MSENEFRQLALEFAGAIESSHMNHPDFRIKNKVFASLGYPRTGCAMVKLTPPQQATFMRQEPGVFSPCNGAWGKQGATYIELAMVAQESVQAALDAARNNLVSKAKSKRGSSSRTQKKPRAESVP
jgi:hypothetical protein